MNVTHPQRIIDAHCHIGEIPPWKFYDLEHPVKPTVYDYRSPAEFVKNHMDEFKVEPVIPGLAVEGDPQLLTSAVMNLLHNAFKNTPAGGSVVLRARAEHERLLVEVEDECGGFPETKADVFQVFGERRSRDRSGQKRNRR